MSTIFEPAPASSMDSRLARDDRASGGAIVAGMVVALLALVWLGMLGMGVGAWRPDLSGSPVPPVGSAWIGVAALVASLLGGMAAGRLSGAPKGNTARWHGLVSWCAATLVLMLLLTIVTGNIFGGLLTSTPSAGPTTGALYGCGAMLVGALAAWLGGGLGAPSREEF